MKIQLLSPDSPIPEFSHDWTDSVMVIKAGRSVSIESVHSDVENGSVYQGSISSISIDSRASSPASVASERESKSVLSAVLHRVPSPASTDSAHIMGDPMSADHRTKSYVALLFDTENKSLPQVDKGSENDNRNIVSDVEERPVYLESLADYRPVSLSLPASVLSDTESANLHLQSFVENRPLCPDSNGPTNERGPLKNIVIDLPPNEDMALFTENTFGEKSNVIVNLKKSKTEDEGSACILSKSVEENFKRHTKTEAPKTGLVVPNDSKSDIVTQLTGAEVLAPVKEEIGCEIFDEGELNPTTEKTKSARKKKSKKSVKYKYSECKPEQNFTNDQKEASEFLTKTHSLAVPSLLGTASDHLPLALACTTDLPEDQHIPADSSASVSQHHIPLTEPVFSLVHNPEPWKLISQIHDPQYVGETFMSKTGVFQFAETRAEFCQANSDQLENDQRSPSPEEYTPMDPELWEEQESVRSASSLSGRSVDSRCALTPDSPVPQFLPSFSASFQLYHRSRSTQSVLSDLEMETDLNISFLFEARPASPDSLLNTYKVLSLVSHIPDYRESLPESLIIARSNWSSSAEPVASDLELQTTLFAEKRPSSPDSVDENRPLSPDSPIPVFQQTLPEIDMKKSSSPISACAESDISDEYEQSSEDIQTDRLDSNQSPESPEVPDTTNRLLHGSSPSLQAVKVPVYRLVSDAKLRKLISQIRDPQYNGETFSKKTWGSEYAGTRLEYILEDSDRKGTEPDVGVKLEITNSTRIKGEEKTLSPDSPIPESRPALPIPNVGGSSYSSSSPESLASDIELAPLMVQLFEVEERPQSPQSVLSFFECCLSADSPIPQYTHTEPAALAVMCRSASLESLYSDEELETDLCIPWLFEDRGESPDSTTSKDEFRRLSPDSPIPEFTQALQESTISHIDSMSSSLSSVLSDLEMEIDLPLSFEDQPSSPTFLSIVNQHRQVSPDSPIPDFRPALPIQNVGGSSYRSSSPESLASDIELAPLMVQLFEVEERPQSPQSVLSFFECCLSPDSPIPQYTHTEPAALAVMCRSASLESLYSDEELETDLCIPWLFEERADSPDSNTSKDNIRPFSPDSPIPQFTQALQESCISDPELRSPTPDSDFSDFEMELGFPTFLESRPLSPESQASIRLSPDSPVPDFMQPVVSEAVFGHRSMSPESTCSDAEYIVISLKSLVYENRPLSSGSGASADEYCALSSDSPIPEYIPTMPENVTMNAGYRSPSPESIESDVEYAFSDFLMSMKYDVGDRPKSPESIGSDVTAEYNNLSPVTTMLLGSLPSKHAHSPDEDRRLSETTTAEAHYAYLFPKESLVLQKEDSKANSRDDHDADATVTHSEVTHGFTTTPRADDRFLCTLGAQVISDIAVSESLPPVVEHILYSGAPPYRGTKYRFEMPACEKITDSDSERKVYYSLESLTEDRAMSPISVAVVEARASSPESANSVNSLRPLSPDSPLPKFMTALPECVTLLRSQSSSPETGESDDDLMPVDFQNNFAQCRSSSPESAGGQNDRDLPLTCQSLPEYRPMSLELAIQTTDDRASSPESVFEFNENRPLSPDSPIPQFTVSLEEGTTTHRSSSPESVGSYSECDFLATWSQFMETERPSSPESISSVNEFRRLLPDSPVPDFMRILSSYFMDANLVYRSPSPASLSSDFEYVASASDCCMEDISRPVSPQTVEPEKDVGLGCEQTERLISKPELLSHVISSFMQEQPSLMARKTQIAASPLQLQTNKLNPNDEHMSSSLQIMTGSEVDVLSNVEWMQCGTEVYEEDFSLKSSPLQDVNREGEKILHSSCGEPKNKTSSQMAAPQTPEDTQFQNGNEVKSKHLSATTVTRDDSQIGLVFTDSKPVKSVPIQLPDQNSYATHRTVSPLLHSLEKTLCLGEDESQGYSEWKLSPKESPSTELLSPTSSQFLVPPDYESVFSGRQNLRVSECSQASMNDLSPVSPVFSDSIQTHVLTEATAEGNVFEFSPDFNRVLSEFEKTVSDFETEKPKLSQKDLSKSSASPQNSDSDVEFFDCKQVFSDLSEPEEIKLGHDITHHISEPPSPMPGSSLDIGFLKESPQYIASSVLQLEDYKRFSSGSESLGDFAYDSEGSQECQIEDDLPICEELPSRDQAGYYDDDDFLGREIAEELGMLSSDSSEEEVLTTRVVRRRIIIQADNLPDIPSQTVTEEKFIDEHGNMVVKKITRKVIRKYVSADGMESQEVTIEGSHQETVQIEEGDTVSRVVKRTVLHSEGDQRELTLAEPPALGGATASVFEVEPVQGRKVSKVVKTTVVRGERMEKQMGDPSLAADLPSAREDFEKALSYAGGFGKVFLPHVVENEIVQDDGSVVKRSQMHESQTQKRTVVRDAQGKHVHLERLHNTPDAPQPNALQQHLHRLLQRYCEDEQEKKDDEEGEEEEKNLD
ncbi:Ankyrin-2 [Channa argus]|uniref:Ankyrin-2 n=1 Tax=Channa argus TaxID=215402 RepID=A0A6G1Q4T5_CHAAH|nr:Ankyrin-2 [Channa argus]